MNYKRTKTSVWLYTFSGLFLIVTCMAAMTVVYLWFPDLPGTIESKLDLDNLTQVVIPGSKEITFSKKGAYAVYYEYHSVVDGTVYTTSETPPPLTCTLTSSKTGEEIRTTYDYVKTNTYSTKERERVGVLIQSISIRKPGKYNFSCRYTDESSQPEIVLAVGPNFVWEFFGIAARSVATLTAGLVAIFISVVVTIIIAFVNAVKRHQSHLAVVGG